MSPDDYHLIAGDKLFMTFSTAKAKYTAIDRAEIINMVDTGDVPDDFIKDDESILVILGKTRDSEMVPPWLWGCVTIRNYLAEEE